MRTSTSDIIKVGKEKYTVQKWNGLDTDVLTTCRKTFPVKDIETVNWSYVKETKELIRIYYRNYSFTQLTIGSSTYNSWRTNKNSQDWYWNVFGYMTNDLRKFKCEEHQIFYTKKFDIDRCPLCTDDNSKEFQI